MAQNTSQTFLDLESVSDKQCKALEFWVPLREPPVLVLGASLEEKCGEQDDVWPTVS